MKHIIRKETFETNSSSSHTITIMTADKWDDFKNTDKYLADWEGQLYLVDDLIDGIKDNPDAYPDVYEDNVDLSNREKCIKYLTKPHHGWAYAEYFTYETWGEYDKWSDWAEVDVERFESPSGDKMVVVCTYGYNC